MSEDKTPADPSEGAQERTGQADSETAPDVARGAAREDASPPTVHRWPAWLALVFSLAALGAAGWLLWQSFEAPLEADFSQRLETVDGAIDSQARGLRQQALRSQEQAERLQALNDRIARFESRLSAVAERPDGPGAELSSLRERVSGQVERIDSLQSTLSELRGELESAIPELRDRVGELQSRRDTQLAEMLSGAEFRLALIEAAGLLRLGQARAELSGQAGEALEAYRLAGSRLDGLEDPRVERLRREVAREITRLESVEPVDWSALGARLSALEAGVTQWPLAGAATAATPRGEVAGGDEESSGFWGRLGNSLSGLVRISPRESAPLSPAAGASIRERLRLHLAAAQAAAARRNAEELKLQAGQAGELLAAHFETSARPVAQALTALEEVAAIDTASLPELGDALAAIEQRLADS